MLEKLCEYYFKKVLIIIVFFLQLSGCNNYFYNLIVLFKFDSKLNV